MLAFHIKDGTVVGAFLVRDLPAVPAGCTEVTRWDLRSFDVAQELAHRATEALGVRYIAVDLGPSCTPRYDVVLAFEVGEEVSYAFNGDCYPCGTIVSIGKGRQERIVTSTGKVFRRTGLTGRWSSEGGGTWGLVHGHHYKQNPHL